MSDERTPRPAWAEEMELGIITEVGKAIAAAEARLRSEITALREDVTTGFGELGDDLTVAMGALADRDRRHDNLSEDVRALREAQVGVLRRLRAIERRLHMGDPETPTEG